MAKKKSTAASPTSEPEMASPLELATLAALINPAGCRSGGSNDALLHAMALLEESAALLREMGPMSRIERINLLHERFLECVVTGKDGASHLLRALADPIVNAPPPVLTLALRNADDDTLRQYLAEHANLEGKTSRKSWFNIRTIHNNLRAWLIACINEDNTANAASIHARDERDRKEAKERGCSVEELRNGRGSYTHEVWQDAEQYCVEWFTRHEVHKDGKLARYEIPQELVDKLIKWKREIRQQPGGIRSVRILTREKVLLPPAKKKNPKKRK